MEAALFIDREWKKTSHIVGNIVYKPPGITRRANGGLKRPLRLPQKHKWRSASNMVYKSATVNSLALAQLGGGGDIISIIISLVWLSTLMLFFFFPGFTQKLQMGYMLRDLERKVGKLKVIRDEVRARTLESVKKTGKPESDPTQHIDGLMEFFVIQPETMDPYGVVYKLEHLLETGESEFESHVRGLCPAAQEYQVKNMSNLVEVARGINTLYRVIRHFYLLGKKTSNIYIVLQIQMLIPQIMEIAEAYRQASIAFSQGQPIGDGVGVLAVAKLAYGLEKNREEIAKDTMASEIEYEGRRVLVVRATGPGGNVGRPGEGVKRLLEREGGAVKLIITVDAALKLEGEDSGKVVEGIGVAIGGPGIDKYKVEEVAKTNAIPLYAIVIYESIMDAITPMKETIAKAADAVVEKIKKVIVDKAQAGSTVIVSGIGNSIGVA